MPIHVLLQHLLFGLTLAGFSAAATWVLMGRLRIMDHPNERSSHVRPTPRSGGIAIVATFAAGMAALYGLMDTVEIGASYFLGFYASALLLVVVSVIDDIRNVGFLVKLSTQALAAGLAMAMGIVITEIPVPFIAYVELGWLGYVLTLVWMLGLTNAFNFMDGLDGLAGGTAALAGTLFALVTFLEGSHFVYLASYVVVAGCLGFLVFNFPPAKIFMGDVGSQFLGFVFAVLAVIAMRYDLSHTSFLTMPLLFFHFIWDTGFTLLRRWRAGENLASGHRSHLYQLLNRLGHSHRRVSLYHYAVTLAQGAGALALIHIPGNARLLVFLPFIAWQTVYTVVVVRAARRAGLLTPSAGPRSVVVSSRKVEQPAGHAE